MAFPRKLKMAPTMLLMIAGNASAVFPASIFKHFFRVPLPFDGVPPVPPLPPPKALVMTRTIVAMVTEKGVNIENIVIPCSRNKVRILSAKDVSLSRTFSSICLILPTCVWRSFRFCDSISSLAFFFGIQII